MKLEATRLFGEGHSCSQAVLAAFAPSLGLESGQAAGIAAGFGSGMRLGQACGAVTAGIMVLGLASRDRSCTAPDVRAGVTSVADEFVERFRERVGAVDCPDIMGVDTRVAEERAAALATGLKESRCIPAVRIAAEILEEMLPERAKASK
jgi:C_GCAxxG_C_C family probable redox protein